MEQVSQQQQSMSARMGATGANQTQNVNQTYEGEDGQKSRDKQRGVSVGERVPRSRPSPNQLAKRMASGC